MPIGDEVSQPIHVDGFFMKLWSYRSGDSAAQQDGIHPSATRQVSPLLIAKRVEMLPSPLESARRPSWILLGTLAGAGMIGVFASFWYWREDRRWRAWRSKEHDRDRANGV
jgi:hypothetical protein